MDTLKEILYTMKSALNSLTLRHSPTPIDLTDRLVKLTRSMKAGNSSLQLRNEAIEILDHLLRKNEISKKQYNAYTKRYFS